MVDLITCWVLGTGPCGQICRPTDIGKASGMDLLGNFTADVRTHFGGSKSSFIPLSNIVRSNFTQQVLDVNVKEGWEQQRMKFTFKLEPNISSEDLRY